MSKQAAPGTRPGRPGRPGLGRLRPAGPATAARTPFVLLVVALLAGGLITLLLLNSALNQGSFQLSRLKRETTSLTDEQQALQRDVDAYSAPDALERRARELGLVPGGSPAFLEASGSVRGSASPAAAPAPPPAPTPEPATPTAPSAAGAGAEPASAQSAAGPDPAAPLSPSPSTPVADSPSPGPSKSVPEPLGAPAGLSTKPASTPGR
ncbi:septum formation initiator [Streptomyces sp. NPDC006879]|uniref:FtsB family cell division protein n=1 Tax=Streptomyces sp. NPDC006879 TaxID=3364767 RepID=UPI003690108B